MHSVEKFTRLSAQGKFRGWPLAGRPEFGPTIPHFGDVMHYQLRTGDNGIEDYT